MVWLGINSKKLEIIKNLLIKMAQQKKKKKKKNLTNSGNVVIWSEIFEF